MTLKQIIQNVEELENNFHEVSWGDREMCLADMIYGIAAASKNLSAFDVINICKDILKEYMPEPAPENNEEAE